MRELGAGLLALLPWSAGCCSIQDDDWRFGLSRSFYGELADKMDKNEPVIDTLPLGQDGMALMIQAAMFGLPLVLDLAFFPGAAIHDAWAE